MASDISNSAIKLFEFRIDQLNGVYHVKTIFGKVVSNIIVLFISVVVFNRLSRNKTYTVLRPSHVVKLCHVVDVHIVQLLGFGELPYAIWIPFTHVSTGQVTFKVIHVVFIYDESSLIINDQDVGAILSYKYVHVSEYQVVEILSCIENLIFKSEVKFNHVL